MENRLARQGPPRKQRGFETDVQNGLFCRVFFVSLISLRFVPFSFELVYYIVLKSSRSDDFLTFFPFRKFPAHAKTVTVEGILAAPETIIKKKRHKAGMPGRPSRCIFRRCEQIETQRLGPLGFVFDLCEPPLGCWRWSICCTMYGNGCTKLRNSDSFRLYLGFRIPSNDPCFTPVILVPETFRSWSFWLRKKTQGFTMWVITSLTIRRFSCWESAGESLGCWVLARCRTGTLKLV